MKVFAVRIGRKYGVEYEKYLRTKLPDISFINEPKEDFILQWNKIHFFNLDIDEPICVIDIDILLENNYLEMFEYPIQRGEFLSMRSWWEEAGACELNGGFYKFYPNDTKYIYEEFKANKLKWERYFINQGLKKGPVAGEENFVDMMVRKQLNIKFVPDGWVCRMVNNPNKEWLSNINKKYDGDYMFLGGKYNPAIKLIHFTKVGNYPKHPL